MTLVASTMRNAVRIRDLIRHQPILNNSYCLHRLCLEFTSCLSGHKNVHWGATSSKVRTYQCGMSKAQSCIYIYTLFWAVMGSFYAALKPFLACDAFVSQVNT